MVGVEQVAGAQAGAATDLHDQTVASTVRLEQGEDARCAIVGAEAEAAVMGSREVHAVRLLFGGI
ncbi:hypothetical protein [Amycolatopsis taiwanensis]|uniref:Uncharacterized protein n=1 Tax=Amycolatopsis taiwanensis TaxID=342230 RepID=A0A9W6VG36_9PSEU|nr:hypothetical protein [Amycolatopsis taiwanensis]GLY65106.1 hypothetical protein Atai01_17250 [Amycolatopsis taiwanensis]